MKNIGQRLREFRKDLGMSGKVFGEKIGLSKTMLSDREQGKRNILVEDIYKIKQEFNVNPNWLILGEGKKNLCDNEENQELIDMISQSSDSELYVDFMKKDIINKIITKLFFDETIYNTLFLQKIKYENKYISIFVNILQNLNTCSSKSHKDYLLKIIEEYKDEASSTKEVKKVLFSLVSGLTEKDCFYLVDNKNITIDTVKNRSLSFSVIKQ